MAQDLGRVSGPLLSDNLLRHGTDLAFETSLLYLNVNTMKIGINTDSPTRDLTVNDTIGTTNIIVDTQADIASLSIFNNKIQNVTGPIYIRPNQSLNPQVLTTKIATSNLEISNQLIHNIIPDSNIEISPTGIVKFYTNTVNINGDFHATGNITWDGTTITFGDSNLDNVFFNSDISSDIIPDINNLYDLGSQDKRWNKLYSQNIVANDITVDNFTVNNIDLLLKQGNTIYVSVNGNDLYTSASTQYTGVYDNAGEYLIGDIVLYNGIYYKRIADPINQGYPPPDQVRWVTTVLNSNDGRHQHSPFRTIKKALSVAQPGDEVVIFPGTYQEIFPLTVPSGVNVRGAGLRSVTVKPTVGTKYNDAFLLNGETTVSFLTIQDFFYDAVNNTGYGFRFAPDISITSKSPYVFNVTIITNGSITTPDDTLGFNVGDAGAGIYLDGSVASTSTSIVPSGLFNSVTLITPNQDAITATNGVRVEWINCFTYFAKRGIYLTNGTSGFANLGVKFGAEFRSINSATIYGTYGAVADGNHTVGYLTTHNFGFVGSNGNSLNDRKTANVDNEVVKLNDGEIWYDSVNHDGDFRIGDVFYISQDTGKVVVNTQRFDISSGGSIRIDGPDGYIIIEAADVQVSNIKIHDNDIDSLFGPVNFVAASNKTTLNTDVYVTGKVDVTSDVYIKGKLYLGDQVTDTVAIKPDLTQTIKPDLNNTFTLGHKGVDPKVWDTLFVHLIDIDGVTQLTNNTISTLTPNTDIRLVASGTGIIHVSLTDVQIDNSLTTNGIMTINGVTSLKNTEIVGTVTLVGDLNQTGSTGIIGTFGNHNIEILGSNSYFSVPDIKIQTNKISVTAPNTDFNIVANNNGSVILDRRIKIKDDEISNRWIGATTDYQKSIVFSPNGTGNTVINTTKYFTLPIGNNSNKILTLNGEMRQNSTSFLYEGYSTAGYVTFTNLYDTDRHTSITPELIPGANDGILRFTANDILQTTIDSQKLTTIKLEVDDIQAFSNTINNRISDSDIFLTPTGTGSVILDNIPFKDNNITNILNTGFTLVGTNTGYIKFSGTGAIVIPAGPTTDRRLTPELGELRQNTTIQKLEVFNGTDWIQATGPLGNATYDEVEDILNTWSIILG